MIYNADIQKHFLPSLKEEVIWNHPAAQAAIAEVQAVAPTTREDWDRAARAEVAQAQAELDIADAKAAAMSYLVGYTAAITSIAAWCGWWLSHL